MEFRGRLRDRRQRLLVHWAGRGSESALRQLYRELYDPVLGYLAARLRPREDAEDVCSQVFLRWISRLSQFDPARGSVYTWTMQIARNLLIDHLRQRREHDSLEPLADRLTATSPGPLEGLLEAEERQLLDGVLAGHDPEVREMFSLRFADGMRYAEIAALLGMTEAAVKQRFSRTLRQLRKELELRTYEGGAKHAGWKANPQRSA